MEFITEYKNCTGCSACANICPTNSIKMQETQEGFYYPAINNTTCVNCALCITTCPVNTDYENQNTDAPIYYIVQNEDQIRLNSTSGGFFHAAADYTLQHGGLVAGAGFDSDVSVKHLAVTDKQDLQCLMGSKYVQSQTGDIFTKVGESLKNGTLTLFTGTPCQIAGLSSFLDSKNIKKDKLLLLELRCFGVPSPGLFRKYIKYIERIYGKQVKNVNFRDKKFGYAASTVSVTFHDESKISNNYKIKTYSKTFFARLNMRLSCYECRFREVEKSYADFIVGDFHTFKSVDRKWDDDLGTSFVIVKTDLAKRVWSQLDTIRYEKLSVAAGEIRNPIQPECRKDFFDDSRKMEWESLLRKYCPEDKRDFFAARLKPVIQRIPFSKKIFQFIKYLNTRHYQKNTRRKI